MTCKAITLILSFSLLFSSSVSAAIYLTWTEARKGKTEDKIITRYDGVDGEVTHYLSETSKRKSDSIVFEIPAGSDERPDLLRYMMQYLSRERLFMAGSNRLTLPVVDYDRANFSFPLFPIGLLPGFSSSYRPLRVEGRGSLHNSVYVHLRAVRQPTVKLSDSEKTENRLVSDEPGTSSRPLRNLTMPESDMPESTCTVVISYEFGKYRIFVIKGFVKAARIHTIIHQTICGRGYERHTYYHTSVDEDSFHRLLGLDSGNEWMDGERAQPITPVQASTNTQTDTSARLLQEMAPALFFLLYVVDSLRKA